MSGIKVSSKSIKIGATTTHATVAASKEVAKSIPSLATLAEGIGDPQVRNRGTIGGSISNNDPSACYPSACMALNAVIHTNKRKIDAEKFFVGMFETALKSGELAGDAVVAALQENDLSAERLGSWGKDYVRGMDRMRRLVYEFYDGFNFGKFVKRFPHLRGHVTDLLIGDLFNERLDEIIEPLEILRAEQEAAAH